MSLKWSERNQSNINLDDLVWVELPNDQSFLMVMETLTRIGVPSKNEKKLTQSCHILHKRGKYAIVHFKELFLLDGKQADFTEEDKARRNTIANLLHDWRLVNLTEKSMKMVEEPVVPVSQIKIITSIEKPNWELVSKYSIGKKGQ